MFKTTKKQSERADEGPVLRELKGGGGHQDNGCLLLFGEVITFIPRGLPHMGGEGGRGGVPKIP